VSAWSPKATRRRSSWRERATKAALEQLTRAWAAEFGPRGVAVNCVAPGRLLAPFSEKYLGLSDPETHARVEAAIPAG
jgi:NAD(P)-dependent dehydrogenase (short-subunit alcohol dehydrogenase family)